jgi:hypothetical protein
MWDSIWTSYYTIKWKFRKVDSGMYLFGAAYVVLITYIVLTWTGVIW